MQSRTHAGSDRRLRRARYAGAAAIAFVAIALPAAAQASVIEEAADGSLRLRGSGNESNLVSVNMPSGVTVQDLAGIQTRTPLCAQVSKLRVACAIGVPINEILLGNGNDIIAVDVPNRVVVDGGGGNDALDGGKGTDATRVTYRGGDGFDAVSYSTTDRAVRVNPATFDGRIGFDEDAILSDVERIGGSRFNDELVSLNFNGEITSDRGDDVLVANGAQGAITRFDMGRRADGADTVAHGPGVSFVNYTGRTLPVNVTVGSTNRDDGEAGEGDQIFTRTQASILVYGGSADDTLSNATNASPSSSVSLNGGPGRDRLTGNEFADFMDGGPDSDTFAGGGGNDFIIATDGIGDIVGCGAGTDTANLDRADGFSGCENIRQVGKLELTPKSSRAQAGKPAQLKLRWSHPQSWQKLRSVKLRLLDGGVPVGEITITPRTERMAADSELFDLVRNRSRLSRNGKTVEAQLAVKLDDSLAGRTLTAEVEATDTKGARQLETDAARVRVAP